MASETTYVADAYELRSVPGLGRTLVALRDIEPGVLLLHEVAHIIATPLHRLPRPLRKKYCEGAEVRTLLFKAIATSLHLSTTGRCTI